MRVKERLEKLIADLYRRVEDNERLTILVGGLDGFLFGNSAAMTTAAPYIRDGIGTQRYMAMPIIAVFPATLASVYFFGWRALAIIVVSYLSGSLVELGFSYVRKEEISEGLLVTGILFPLTLPPTLPLWMVALGMIVGVGIGKEIFGGTGHNIFNPALVGRAFLAAAFPVAMTTRWYEPATPIWGGFLKYTPDAITKATPLGMMKFDQLPTPWIKLLLGNVSGSLGETSALLLILGGLFLIVTKAIDWRIPLSYIAIAGLLSTLLWRIDPSRFADPLFHLLAGGLMLGAFFMATDPVTSPMTIKGKWIFGIGLGVLTMLMRTFTGLVEGVMFAILIGNMFTPLINSITLPKSFAGRKGEDLGRTSSTSGR